MPDATAAWRDRALCAGDLDFDDASNVQSSVRTCQDCPVLAECAAWVATEKFFDGVAAGKVWRKRSGPVFPQVFGDWSLGDRRSAHAAYVAGSRTDWVREGERAYQSARKRERRAELREEAAA